MDPKIYTPDELQAVLDEHKKWLADDGGSRADLSRANLYGADLSRADLSRANLYGADLSGANLYGADLSGANLSGANLSGANLSGANLYGADLSGANLYGANLSRADLSRANLYRADLYGANLYGADLYGADLSGANLYGVKVLKAAAFGGLYRYIAMPVIAEDGTEYIRLGCHFRRVSEWEGDFWNNPREFPNDGGAASLQRLMAYQTCLKWLEIHRQVKA